MAACSEPTMALGWMGRHLSFGGPDFFEPCQDEKREAAEQLYCRALRLGPPSLKWNHLKNQVATLIGKMERGIYWDGTSCPPMEDARHRQYVS